VSDTLRLALCCFLCLLRHVRSPFASLSAPQNFCRRNNITYLTFPLAMYYFKALSPSLLVLSTKTGRIRFLFCILLWCLKLSYKIICPIIKLYIRLYVSAISPIRLPSWEHMFTNHTHLTDLEFSCSECEHLNYIKVLIT
jgi:hypothetical protein